MNDPKVILRELSLSNSSDRDLEIWLEWDVPDRYMVTPNQRVLVQGVVRDAHVDQGEGHHWEISVDAANNSVTVYMLEQLLLIEDFYLIDRLTSERIEPARN